MKKVNFYRLLFFSTALITINSCTESDEPFVYKTTSGPSKTNSTDSTNNTNNSTNNNTSTSPKQELIVLAGADNQVILPTDYSNLKGAYIHLGIVNEIDNLVWKKISGPSPYIFEKPNSIETKVSKMDKGTYEFELTITDKGGLTAKDTVRVIVGEFSSPPKVIIYNDLTWLCPFDCRFVIKNLYSRLPAGSVFRVYIQRDNSPDWIEVIQLSQWTANNHYYYDLYNDSLEIYNSNLAVIDTPNIKIVY
jgi:hypothetical protein